MPKVNDLKQFILMERQQRNNLAAFNLLAKKEDAVSQLKDYINASDKRTNILHINDLKYGQPTDSDLKTMTARLKVLQTSFNDLTIPEPFSNSSEEIESELKFIRMLRKLSEDPDTVRDIDDEDKDLISPFIRFCKAHNLPADETFLRLLVDDVNTLTMRFKYMFNRPRPKQLAAQKDLELVAHQGESANSPAYPSAHSTAGRVISRALGDKYPTYADEFEKIGASIGLHRLIAGLHYPTDHAAGMMLGDQIYTKGLVKDHTNFMMPESEDLVQAVQQAITKHAEGFNLNKSIDDIGVLVDIFKAEGEQQQHIFVFGSNLKGIHGAGAAKDAKELHGAVQGVGRGLTGNSYALPTKKTPAREKRQFTISELQEHVNEFVQFMEDNPEMVFHIADLGTNLAGYKPEEIADAFDRAGILDLIPRVEEGGILFGEKVAPLLFSKGEYTYDPSVFNSYPHLEQPDTPQANNSGITFGEPSRPDESRNVTIHSGGATGGDAAWAKLTKLVQQGVAGKTNAWSFKGHNISEGEPREIANLMDDSETSRRLALTGKNLGRPIPTSNYAAKLVHRNWFQVREAHAVIASVVGFDKKNPDKVDGGTGWAVQMGIDEKIPVHIFNESTKQWYTWDNSPEKQEWNEVNIEDIPFYQEFAGVGSRRIGELGEKAIADYGKRLEAFQKTDKPFTPLNDTASVIRENRIPNNLKLKILRKKLPDDAAARKVEEARRQAWREDPKNIHPKAVGHENADFFRQLSNEFEGKITIDGVDYGSVNEAYRGRDREYTKYGVPGYRGTSYGPLTDESDEVTRRFTGLEDKFGDTPFPITGDQTPDQKMRNDFRFMVSLLTAKLEQSETLKDTLQSLASNNVDKDGNREPMEVLRYIQSLNHNTESSLLGDDTRWGGEGMQSNFVRALHNAYVNVSSDNLEIPDQVQEVSYADDDPITPKVKNFVEGVDIPQVTWNEMSDEAKRNVILGTKYLPPNPDFLSVDPSYRAAEAAKVEGELTGISSDETRIAEYESKPFERKDPDAGGSTFADIVQEIIPSLSRFIEESATRPTHIVRLNKQDYFDLIPTGKRRPDNGDPTGTVNVEDMQIYQMYESGVRDPDGSFEDGAKITLDDIRNSDTSGVLFKVIALPPDEEIRRALNLGLPEEQAAMEGLEPLAKPSDPVDINAYRIQEYARKFPMDVRETYMSEMLWGKSYDKNTGEFKGVSVKGVMAKSPNEMKWGLGKQNYRGGTIRQLVELANRLDNYGNRAAGDEFDDVLDVVRGQLGQRQYAGSMARIVDAVANLHATYYPPNQPNEPRRVYTDSMKGSDEGIAVADVINEAIASPEWREYDNTLEGEKEKTAKEIELEFGRQFGNLRDQMYPEQRQYFDESASAEFGMKSLRKHFLRASLRGAYNPETGVINPNRMAPWVKKRVATLRQELIENFNAINEFPNDEPPKPPEEPEMEIADAEDLEPAELEELKQQWEDYETAKAGFPAKLERYKATGADGKPTRKTMDSVLKALLDGGLGRKPTPNEEPLPDRRNVGTLYNRDMWADNRNLDLFTEVFLDPIPTDKEGNEFSGSLYRRYAKADLRMQNNTFFSEDNFKSYHVSHSDLQTFMKVMGITGGEGRFLSQAQATLGSENRYAPVTTYNVARPNQRTTDEKISVGLATDQIDDKTKKWLDKPGNTHYRILMSGMGNQFKEMVQKRIEELKGTSDPRDIMDSSGNLKTTVLKRLEKDVHSQFAKTFHKYVKQYDPDGDNLGSDPQLEDFKARFIESSDNDMTDVGDKFYEVDRASYLPNTPRPNRVRDEYANWHREKALQGAALKLTGKGFGELSEADQKQLEDRYYQNLGGFSRVTPEGAQPYLGIGTENSLSGVTNKYPLLKPGYLNDPMFREFYRGNYGKSPEQAMREWEDFDAGVIRRTFRKVAGVPESTINPETGELVSNLESEVGETKVIPDDERLRTFGGELGYASETAADRATDVDYEEQLGAIFDSVLPNSDELFRDQIMGMFEAPGSLDDIYFGTSDTQSALANSSDPDRLKGYFRGVRKVLQAIRDNNVVLPDELVSSSSSQGVQLRPIAENIIMREVANIIDTSSTPDDPETLLKENYSDMSDDDFKAMKVAAKTEFDNWYAALPKSKQENYDKFYSPAVGKKGHKNIGAEAGTDQTAEITTESKQDVLRRANLPLAERETIPYFAPVEPTQARSVSDIIEGKDDDPDARRPRVNWGDGKTPKYTLLDPEQQKAIYTREVQRRNQSVKDRAAWEAAKKEEEPPTKPFVHEGWNDYRDKQFGPPTAAQDTEEILEEGKNDPRFYTQPKPKYTPTNPEQETITRPAEEKTSKPEQKIVSPSPKEVKTAQEAAGAEYTARVARPVGEGIEDANK